MLIKGKLNKVSDGQYGVGILVTGHDGFINSKDSLASIEKNVRQGDFVEVDVDVVNKNGKTYYNFKADSIRKAEGGATTSAKASDKVDGAVRGMAFNNAVQVALAAGKANDDEFLIAQTVRLYKLQARIEAAISTPTEEATTEPTSVDSVLAGLDFAAA